MGDRRLAAMREKGWNREHQPARAEVERHLHAARAHLDAADLKGIAALPRFTLTYDAAHAASLAALKLAGYRTGDSEAHRVHALNAAELVLPLKKGTSSTFQEANRLRNVATYHGAEFDVPDSLMEALRIGADEALAEARSLLMKSPIK
jgi:hypothetical protein